MLVLVCVRHQAKQHVLTMCGMQVTIKGYADTAGLVAKHAEAHDSRHEKLCILWPSKCVSPYAHYYRGLMQRTHAPAAHASAKAPAIA